VAFSPDGKQLVSTSGTWAEPEVVGDVKLWDVATAKELLTLPTRHTKAVWFVCFSPDGKMLATASRDRTVKLWETATWRERLSLSLNPRAAAEAGSLSSSEVGNLWNDLGDPDAAKAYRALRRLVQAAPQAVARAKKIQLPLAVWPRRSPAGAVAPDSQVEAVPTGPQLRALRVIEMLEQIGTQEARQVLERLAKGDPESPATREAKASLERLALQPVPMP
jgi:hypothetical protein